jgi:hypothetical protein
MADRWRIAVHEAGHFEEAAQTCGASEPPAWGWGKAQRETLSAPRVRLLPSTGRDPFCGSPQIALRHPQLGIGSRRGQARERVSAILLSYVLRPLDGGDDASVVQDAILRHYRRRRQEHQQHQQRDPKSGDRQFGSQVDDQILNGKTGEAASE